MKPAVPWSVKGVEPDAREAAKRAARSAGMTLGAWLNQKLLESEGASLGAPPAPSAGPARPRASDPAFDVAPYPAQHRDPYAHREFAPPSPEMGAVSQSLDALRRHLQDADSRTERTFGQVSRSLEAVLGKLDQVGARRRAQFDEDASDSLRAIKSALSDVTQRLSVVETRPQPVTDLVGIERSVADIGRAFEAANARTGQRIDQVDTSIDKISNRLETGESRRMEAARGLERAVTELTNRIDDTTRRQADAARDTERSIADLQSEGAIREAGLAVSVDTIRERIADLSGQMEATRKSLGKAVSEKDLTKLERRIAEALGNTAKAEDIAQMEARATSAAKAINILGKNIEEVRLGLGQSMPDFAAFESKFDRQFDQITATLESLREEVDGRLNEISDQPAPKNDPRHLDMARIDNTHEALRREQPLPPPEPPVQQPDFVPPATDHGMQEPAPPSGGSDHPAPAPDYMTTARAAVRDHGGKPFVAERPGDGAQKIRGPRLSVILITFLLVSIGVGAIGYSVWSDWKTLQDINNADVYDPNTRGPRTTPPADTAPTERTESQPETTEPQTSRDASVELPERPAEQPAETTSRSTPATEPPVRETAEETPPQTSEPPAQTATRTAPSTSTPVVGPPQPAGPTAIDLYAEAVVLLDTQNLQDDQAAASRLRRAADMGLTIAQYRLATLYETGRGLPEDVDLARAWYLQAAEGGNARAMHNLAVIYAEGGGEPDANFAEAARWFAEAASFGVRDSQFNLAVLFERGLGVRNDNRQAYLWYSIAEAGGDTEAGNRRDVLATRLEDDVRPRIDAAVASWQPRSLDPEANGRITLSRPLGASPTEIARVQELLTFFGYTPGPADGVMGPRTTEAIRQFEQRAGLSVTGRVTPALLSRLEAEIAARSSGG